ncbi:MAG: putative heme exporter protein CcmB [SAR86 cluster bacterium SAR86A]|jgi:heme exporter protein B|uniref:Putative heme exporter protein CcmB n=1 Tax=SAR86 cluster bacterium SAR86A TaxID=1123866 RepID=J5K9F3_9GAMM|nr:MAG: putative heme exporter protein CcmB [SAR86 cluster bacterium SAR86A]|tara:strand:+ start:1553 stop:2200 length:648 start_codon:yes stop_codon:yes gene_type:complete
MNELKLEYLKLKKKTRSWLGPILVFWLIMLAFPLTVEFMQDKLEIGFFSVLWIAILISMMLATEDIFIEDYNDGSLEQTIIKNTSFQFLISIRIIVYWLMIGVPISILSFIFSLGTSEDLLLSISVIPLSIISSYIFLNLFALGSALSLNKGSLLGALITMPLALPVLIVLGKSIIAFQLGINYLEFILLLLGCLSIIIIAVPIIVSFIIKAHLE